MYAITGLKQFWIFFSIDILYKVNIESSRTSHLYELGSTAKFSCTLSPNPIGLIQSSELSYSWTMSRTRLLYRSIAGSNMSIYLYAGFTSGYIHCYTYVNGVYFKSGKYFMAVKGNINLIILLSLWCAMLVRYTVYCR